MLGMVAGYAGDVTFTKGIRESGWTLLMSPEMFSASSLCTVRLSDIQKPESGTQHSARDHVGRGCTHSKTVPSRA